MAIKNFILNAVGWLFLCEGVYNIVSLYAYYYDDIDTVKRARAYPESVLSIKIAVVSIIIAYLSKKMIGNARLFSSFFELDLDGYISYRDLAEITGRGVIITSIEIEFYRFFYMKGFKVYHSRKESQIELDRKTYTCQCKNCGAIIEKASYFVGKCAYCGSSDLHANVIAGNRFYSISTEVSHGNNNPSYYCKNNIKSKTTANYVWLAIIGSLLVINVLYALAHFAHYYDKKYIKSLLFTKNEYFSVELIKKDMLDAAIFGSVFVVAYSVVLFFLIRRMIGLASATAFAKVFSKLKKPFVDSKTLTSKLKYKKPYKRADFSIRRGYLINCTFEKHDNKIFMAIAKKIVKDKCPSCNGPIVGAASENYVCKYCNNMIMGVVKKK